MNARSGFRRVVMGLIVAAAPLAMAAFATAQTDSSSSAPPAAAVSRDTTAKSAKAVPAAPSGSSASGARDECMNCHLELESAEAVAFKNDIHRQRGVSCADCHGGDPNSNDMDVAMSPAKGFKGVPKKQDIPKLCGSCHGGANEGFHARYRLDDVLAEYSQSQHARSLEANPSGAQCVSCHGVHNIVAVTDLRSPVHPGRVVDTCAKCHGNAAYMRDFNPSLPVDQKEKYLTSIHGKRHARGDWKVATCVSCHSNHLVREVKDPRSPVYPTQIPATCAHCHADAKYMASYGIPTTQYRDYKDSVHGKALLEHSDLNAPACNSCHGNHAAAPPGVGSVIAVCGQCHQSNEQLYETSVHEAYFEEKKLGGCIVCHGNHGVQPTADTMVGFAKGSPCAKCHVDAPSDSAASGIHRLRGLLDSLSVGQTRAEAALARAENLGMDVSDARYSLKEVHQAQIQARVAIHSFREAELEEAARPGITIVAKAEDAGHDAVREYLVRRQGLVVSTLIVTLAVILLWMKIRQIEKKQRGEDA